MELPTAQKRLRVSLESSAQVARAGAEAYRDRCGQRATGVSDVGWSRILSLDTESVHG